MIGRKKRYDRDTVVNQAMGLFRSRGFASTSADVLVRELGISRHSLYAEFGSKQGLFDAALRRYDEVVLERNFGPMERPGSGLVEVRSLLAFFGAAHAGPAAGRGCLLCNTAVEFGPDDPGGQGFVQAYFSRVSSAFRVALTGAAQRGEVCLDVDVDAEAALLTSVVLGLFVMIRAKAPAAVIEQAARAAVAHVDRLEAAAP